MDQRAVRRALTPGMFSRWFEKSPAQWTSRAEVEKELHASFLRSLAADTDDTSRLAYADWLDENGDPARAEFVRAQTNLAKWIDSVPPGTALPPDYQRLKFLADRLLEENLVYWIPPRIRNIAGGMIKFVHRRGFIDSAEISLNDLAAPYSASGVTADELGEANHLEALIHQIPTLRRIHYGRRFSEWWAPLGLYGLIDPLPALSEATLERLADAIQNSNITEFDYLIHYEHYAAIRDHLLSPLRGKLRRVRLRIEEAPYAEAVQGIRELFPADVEVLVEVPILIPLPAPEIFIGSL